MMRASSLPQSRGLLSKCVFSFGRIAEIQDASWSPATLTLRAYIFTGIQNPSAPARAGGAPSERVYADYCIFKGKAALSVSPVLPTFAKLDAGRGLKVNRRGCMMLTFMPAVGERKYDWQKKQAFSLSPTEVGSMISLGPSDSCELFHDPAMKSSNAGQVRKSLSVKPHGDGSGYFVSLSVVNNILKTTERFTVPVTTAEFQVMRSAFSFSLPHIMGWGELFSKLPRSSEENELKVVNSENLDSEWER